MKRHEHAIGRSLATAVLLSAAACASGTGGESEAWRRYVEPRPEPLPAAPRVAVSEVRIVGEGDWARGTALTAGEGLTELVGAELLRRRDVHFLERRRFSRAVEREREGLPRPPGAPAIGRSPGAELLAVATWAATGPSTGVLGIRLVESETGVVLDTWQTSTPRPVEPVALARAITGGVLSLLAEGGRLPAWPDPLEGAAPPTPGYAATGIPAEAVEAFFRGADAEDRYDWNAAFQGYLAAAELGGEPFFEPRVALARAARLRAGGTLGAGDQ